MGVDFSRMPHQHSTGLPVVLHRLGKFLERQSIQDVVLGEPGASRLCDAVANFSICEVWWESVLITIFTPCCFAIRK